MSDIAEKLFEDAPKELVEQACKTNRLFKLMAAKKEALEIAQEEFDKINADFEYERKTYARMIKRYPEIKPESAPELK